MSKLERYPAYKESGVEWLGEIPEGWEVKKLKFISKIKTGYTPDMTKSDNYSQDGIIWVKPDNLAEFKPIINSKEKVSFLGLKKQNLIPKDSILVNCIGTIGKFGIAGIDLITNQQINAIIFNAKVIDSFGKYLIFSSKDEHNRHANGNVVQILNSTAQSNIQFPLPPREEQIKIASFLDEKTSQIDKAISQKEKLIELLKERRQIVINEAVTKGLDKDVEFKDSGVEWIGEIPKHWEVKKLKFIIKNKLKYGANESGISYDKELPRYIRITDFSDSGKLSEKNKLSLSWKKGKDYLLKDGDVLFARSGATVGKTYQFKKSMSIEKKYAFAGYLIKAEVNETMILSDYLYLYTNSNLFSRWKESIFNKATIENIGADKYSELLFTLPPIEEQKLILEDYFIKSTKIDKAIELQQNYIAKLGEYKASLIDSVVTGKVRVCDE